MAVKITVTDNSAGSCLVSKSELPNARCITVKLDLRNIMVLAIPAYNANFKEQLLDETHIAEKLLSKSFITHLHTYPKGSWKLMTHSYRHDIKTVGYHTWLELIDDTMTQDIRNLIATDQPIWDPQYDDEDIITG